MRLRSTLVVVEHTNDAVVPVTLNAVTAASRIGGETVALVAGTQCEKVFSNYFCDLCFIGSKIVLITSLI